MDRRSLLKGSLAALCLPFTGIRNVQENYYSPFDKRLGKATEITIETQYETEQMFEQPFRRYVNFPIDFVVKIKYEHGFEEWQAFNVKNDGLKKFSMREFFNSKFVDGEHDYGGHFEYCGTKFRLACISIDDGIRLDKW